MRGGALVRSRRREPVDPPRPRAGRAAAAHEHGRLRPQDRRPAHPERPRSLRHQGGVVHPDLDRRALSRRLSRDRAPGPRGGPPRAPAREAVLPPGRRRGRGSAAAEVARHLQEGARPAAPGLAAAVGGSVEALDGAAEEARLHLSLEPHGHRPAVLPHDPARRAGGAAHGVVQQRLAVLRLQRGAAGRPRHLEPGGRVGDLEGRVRGRLRRRRLLQPDGPSASGRPSLPHADGVAADRAHPRQGRRVDRAIEIAEHYLAQR